MKTKLSGVAFVVAATLLSSVSAAGYVVFSPNPNVMKKQAEKLNVDAFALNTAVTHLTGRVAALTAGGLPQAHHIGIDPSLDLLIAAAHAGGDLVPYIDQVVADAKNRLSIRVNALLAGGNAPFLAAIPVVGDVDVSGTGAAFNMAKPVDDQRDTFIASLDAVLDGFKSMANLAVLDAEVALPGAKDVVEIAKVANAVHHAVAKKVFEYVHGLAAVDAGFTVGGLAGGVKTRDALAMDLAKVAQGPQIKPQTLDEAPEPIYDAAKRSIGQLDCSLLINASIEEAKKRLVDVLDATSGSDADVADFLEDGIADGMANPAVQIRTAANETLDSFAGGGGGGANFPVMITIGRSKFEFRDALFAVLDSHKTMANMLTIDGDIGVPASKKMSQLTTVINAVHAAIGVKIHDFVDGMLHGDTRLVMMPGHLRNKNALRDALRDAADTGF